MVPPAVNPIYGGYPVMPPCPPPNMMFPQSPNSMITQAGMLKTTPNSSLYMSPMAGNKAAGPPMDMASPNWAHYNLLNALNRLYIS